jgi:hypothetical protein
VNALRLRSGGIARFCEDVTSDFMLFPLRSHPIYRAVALAKADEGRGRIIVRLTEKPAIAYAGHQPRKSLSLSVESPDSIGMVQLL